MPYSRISEIEGSKEGRKMPKTIVCPECGVEYEAPEDVMLREILTCPDCSLEVEVTKIEKDRLEYRKIVMEKEDWGE